MKHDTEEREKRMCISYLDEVNAYDNIKNKTFKSIVSISSLKNTYINGLEKSWKELRKKYNVGQGIYLHFTDIKKLLKDPNDVDEDLKNIFTNSKGDIDYSVLYNFYIDVLDIIKDNDFVIQATGIFTEGKNYMLPKFIEVNSLMYQLFKEHLDRMAFYLSYLTIDDMEKRKKVIKGKRNNPEVRWFKSKIRYDGDLKLGFHNDLRNAFSHCIVDGTKHFSSKVIKEFFDNLKFISKQEVASCTNCFTGCGYEIVSHAGSEIIDFIALYVARDMWKEFYKDIMINEKKDYEKEVDKLIQSLTSINIPGFEPIYPIQNISSKIFCTDDIGKYKIIKDYPF